jgi:DNA-binding NarL/FixJ family response regulator
MSFGEVTMPPKVLILSDVRFLREGLAEALTRGCAFTVVGTVGSVDDVAGVSQSSPVQIVLIDTAFPAGPAAVRELHERAPDAKIVAFGLRETEEEVLGWAAAGISGYISRNTELHALAGVLIDIVNGRQLCPTQIASSMLRWIARHGSSSPQGPAVRLTEREDEVARLISAGLSNKEIARRLNISVATTKSHVHKVLSKLKVDRRAQAAICLKTRGRRLPSSSST